MQYQFLKLAFAACLASSLAFADNPTDASLIFDEGDTAAVQKGASISAKKKTEVGQHHRYGGHERQRSLNAKRGHVSKSISEQRN